jgi:hypothetical protein
MGSPLAGRCPKGVLDRYGHLFPESDAALRDRLDLLFRGATEHRRNTAG